MLRVFEGPHMLDATHVRPSLISKVTCHKILHVGFDDKSEWTIAMDSLIRFLPPNSKPSLLLLWWLFFVASLNDWIDRQLVSFFVCSFISCLRILVRPGCCLGFYCRFSLLTSN